MSSHMAEWCVVMMCLASAIVCAQESPKKPILDCYISTGDNHWIGTWLPIDSKAAIESAFDFLKDVCGVRRVYWRGLEEAAWLEGGLKVRQENYRYASFLDWMRWLYKEVDPDATAVAAAHKRGMEIWGVGAMFDWGCQADAPCFGDYPHFAESLLRVEHPEWVPIDRHGVMRQGGPIELAYPQARKTLVDLHARLARKAGYDGVLFITYCENYSMRFQDEFGYNDPIVQEFKKRHGIDIRKQDFTRFATRYDWYHLRGEYVTQFLRELKGVLSKDGKKLGLFVNPFQPNSPQPWNVPELMWTAGNIYMDLEGWVREGIVDELVVYGYCSPQMQERALQRCLWITSHTNTSVSALTSSPFDERWKPFKAQGVPIALAVGEDEAYLQRGDIPEQPLSALKSTEAKLRMKVLAQIIAGKTKATVADIAPLVKESDIIMRRLALKALSKTQDLQAVPIIEKALEDPEHGVRTAAAWALRNINRPESAGKMLVAVEKYPTHPLCEEIAVALTKVKPAPKRELWDAVENSPNPKVRSVAMRALRMLASADQVPMFVKALENPEPYVRYEAAFALANVRKNPAAVEALIKATESQDVVLADRAAVSLGEIAARNEKETEHLRPKILEALKSLFAKLGDGCKRADAEWGYRPVGNALLAMGTEGEAALHEFMNQKTDRRLADTAWKVLYIRQRPHTFSEVTEKENEESFKKRPQWP